ncbi:MAG: PIN domain-containing protein [Methanobrevibacter sp.]|nr:PIN domain-containing protein [Candidatus Methanoflexus mossambicus]
MIFIDYSFLLALIHKNNKHHQIAIEIAKNIKDEKKITTDLIVSDILSKVSQLKNNETTKLIYDYIKDNHIVYETSIEDFDKAISYNDENKKSSFKQSIIIGVMNKLNINRIASFSNDFEKKGFNRIF